VFGAGSIDWPELHASNRTREHRVLINREMRSKRLTTQLINKETSKCRASIRICPSLHKLNKSSTKFADKTRGKHSSQSEDCVAVWHLTAEAVGVQESSSVAHGAERDTQRQAEQSVIVDLIFDT